MTAWSSGASPGRMTREAFRRWVEAQPNGVRYERIDGKPVAMSPERVVHNRLKRRAWQLLDRAIADQGLPCEALADGITVEIGEDQDYEPDAVVHCGDVLDANATSVSSPIIVVEVLSPGSRSRDTGAKLSDYFTLPSVQHYLIIDPDRPRIVHHKRGDSTDILTRIITAGVIDLSPPGISLGISDIYQSVGKPGSC
jgi:Uma2 family endonuclease